MKTLPGILIILLIAVTAISCIRMRTIAYEEQPRDSKPGYFPMEVLQEEQLERDYKVIGEVTATGPNYRTDRMMEKLRKEAREMGDDAIIDFESGSVGGGMISEGSGLYEEDAKQFLKGKVIVWVDQ